MNEMSVANWLLRRSHTGSTSPNQVVVQSAMSVQGQTKDRRQWLEHQRAELVAKRAQCGDPPRSANVVLTRRRVTPPSTTATRTPFQLGADGGEHAPVHGLHDGVSGTA